MWFRSVDGNRSIDSQRLSVYGCRRSLTSDSSSKQTPPVFDVTVTFSDSNPRSGTPRVRGRQDWRRAARPVCWRWNRRRPSRDGTVRSRARLRRCRSARPRPCGNSDESANKGMNLVAPWTDHQEWGIRITHGRDPDGTLIESNEPLDGERLTLHRAVGIRNSKRITVQRTRSTRPAAKLLLGAIEGQDMNARCHRRRS